MTIGIDMYMEIDPEKLEEIKIALERKIDSLIDLDSWPEIRSVYGVEVREVDKDERIRS